MPPASMTVLSDSALFLNLVKSLLRTVHYTLLWSSFAACKFKSAQILPPTTGILFFFETSLYVTIKFGRFAVSLQL